MRLHNLKTGLRSLYLGLISIRECITPELLIFKLACRNEQEELLHYPGIGLWNV